MLKSASSPLIIAGGGVHYSEACETLAYVASEFGIPVAETQAGKGALPWDHPMALGSVGVTGTSAANALAADADLVVGIGTRLQDFTTGSWALFKPDCRIAQVNVTPHDAHKHDALAVVGDAWFTLENLSHELDDWRAPSGWTARVKPAVDAWNEAWETATRAAGGALPSDAQVIGAVWRTVPDDAVVVAAAGGLPGELHKLWRARTADGYHLEYGYSCMGYEIAGALGVKLAAPHREVIAMLGDGSYLMLNSELATSVAMGVKLIVVLLDNRGFGCISRLQQATGGEPFNNLLPEASTIDLVAHARSLGADAEKAGSVAELESAMGRAISSERTFVVVIETDPDRATEAGGAWWDVAVPEVSERNQVRAARKAYEERIEKVRR
jgi:3D-(3,5/4)-trihydroxycyclohexane-1,2-dione acylhydrolase (decyclizing)